MDVLVVGAGRMGSQIACEYAIGGHGVSVWGRTADAARERVAAALETARRAGIVAEDLAGEAGKRIGVVEAFDAVATTPDLVCESIVEDLTAKGELLRDVASRWPEA